MKREGNPGANPWSIDYFNPPTPHVKPPAPKQWKPPTLRNIPDIDRLFSIQDDLVRAINAADAIEHEASRIKGFRELQTNVENAYKLINRYLREFGATVPGGTF